MSAQEWLDRTQEITEKATGGAWEWAPSITTQSRYRPAKVSTLVWDGGDAVEAALPHSTADAEFIAHARTALPQAVAALRAVTDLHQPRNRADAFRMINDQTETPMHYRPLATSTAVGDDDVEVHTVECTGGCARVFDKPHPNPLFICRQCRTRMGHNPY